MAVLVEIDRVVLKVTKTTSGYRADLTANREPWHGHGKSVCKAIRDLVRSIESEKPNEGSTARGRPTNRYVVAASLR